MIRKGIPTTHAGTRFRSRLEARWAALFDAIGWRWEYEPFDLAGYVPDFAILERTPLLVEVKPALTLSELIEHAERLAKSTNREALVVGASPLFSSNDGWDSPVAGLCVQWHSGESEAHIAEAMWGTCPTGECERSFCETAQRSVDHAPARVFHSEGGWSAYPCGHYNGGWGDTDVGDKIGRAWADARNSTQWQP